jgi:hypothetical protein
VNLSKRSLGVTINGGGVTYLRRNRRKLGGSTVDSVEELEQPGGALRGKKRAHERGGRGDFIAAAGDGTGKDIKEELRGGENHARMLPCVILGRR